jgi:hypothetical protein
MTQRWIPYQEAIPPEVLRHRETIRPGAIRRRHSRPEMGNASAWPTACPISPDNADSHNKKQVRPSDLVNGDNDLSDDLEAPTGRR